MSAFNPHNFFNLTAFKHQKLFENCQNVWEVLTFLKEYLQNQPLGKIECDIPQGCYLINPNLISIGKGSVIEPGTYIQGPCIIGENCTVRFGAYIREFFLAGDGCVIGHDTEIKHSIFLNGTHAAHFAYIGDSILGNKVNLGAGTKCANFKLDHSNINIFNKGSYIKTGMRKLGAILGDNCQLGCNSVTNPGTILGKNVLAHPCTILKGVIEDNQIVRMNSKMVSSQYSSFQS